MSTASAPAQQAHEPSARYLRPSLPLATLVDSCVLIDVLVDDPHWADWSLTQLAHLPLVREALPWDAAFLAGQAFKVYCQLQGDKTSPMPDLYIGAHALVSQFQLLTRDGARYRSYFPRLALVVP